MGLSHQKALSLSFANLVATGPTYKVDLFRIRDIYHYQFLVSPVLRPDHPAGVLGTAASGEPDSGACTSALPAR